MVTRKRVRALKMWNRSCAALLGLISFLITWALNYILRCQLDKVTTIFFLFFYRTQCSDGCDPNDVRFLFKVDNVDRRTQSSKYFTIQSAKTGKFLVSDESGNASMREIKDQTDGQTSDREAWFQFIHEDDMVTEKSVHTIREEKIFPGRIYEIQEAVTCELTKMWIAPRRVFKRPCQQGSATAIERLWVT